MSQLTELKIYKKLYEMNKSILTGIHYKAHDRLEYGGEKLNRKEPSRDFEFIESIGDKKKWEYYGTASKEDVKLMEFLEYLLDDKKPAE